MLLKLWTKTLIRVLWLADREQNAYKGLVSLNSTILRKESSRHDEWLEAKIQVVLLFVLIRVYLFLH